MSQTIIVVAINKQTACFRKENTQWMVEKVQGEAWLELSLSHFLDKLDERLALQNGIVQLVYDKASFSETVEALRLLQEKQIQYVQLLFWQPLQDRAAVMTSLSLQAGEVEAFTNTLCPLIEQTFHYQDEVLDAERKSSLIAHEGNIEALRLHTQALQSEKSRLEQQLSAMKRPDVEQVFAFMPLFFETFFLRVKPSDLALISGSLHLPELASTFTEPDASTLMALKRKFTHLPETFQQQLLSTARELKDSHALTIRSSMRALVEGED